MKLKSLSVANFPFFVGVLAVAMAGCANRSICIRAVDAKTRKPLAGVTTEWSEHRHQMFRPLTHYGPTNLPISGQDGQIEVRSLHKNWLSTFVFSCPGYPNLYGRYSGGVLNVGTNVLYYPPGQLDGEFRLQGDTETAVKSNGCFVVPLPKSSE